jgi:hypothetical protein
MPFHRHHSFRFKSLIAQVSLDVVRVVQIDVFSPNMCLKDTYRIGIRIIIRSYQEIHA